MMQPVVLFVTERFEQLRARGVASEVAARLRWKVAGFDITEIAVGLEQCCSVGTWYGARTSSLALTPAAFAHGARQRCPRLLFDHGVTGTVSPVFKTQRLT